MKVEDLKLPFSEDLFLEINNQLIDSLIEPSQLSISPDNSKFITNTKYYGNYSDLDLHILTVEHSGTEDARVGVSLDTFKLMKNYSLQNAIVAAYSKNSDSWRYSLVTSNLSINDKGKITKEFSNPRRYSFVLGPSQKVLTPYKQLIKSGKVSNIKELSKRFSLEVVNNEFYKEIAKLYDELVGTDKITRKLIYPNSGDESHEFAVRLIGRIIFCWFLREKKSKAGVSLVPSNVLSREASNASSYYHNVLAPLFFEVLNKPIPKRTDKFKTGVYADVPYLNGGLFNDDNIDYYKFDKDLGVSIPGLVGVPDSWIHELFDLLERFSFTVDENTSYDLDLSIDPEMLGRVFENLLARINPETGETVRKSTGSFYTPREIVEYMVDASLSEYLVSKVGVNREKIDALISYDLFDDLENALDKEENISILKALSTLTVLDPACGSGAFPIGMLQKIVSIITKLDPNAEWWLAKQLEGASPELRREFTNRSVDYVRKLGVIRQTIFGVDIQPIATEISRLRCFLTLIVDEAVDDTQENRGIRPLPNLDFKFVTANSLISLPKPEDKKGDIAETQAAMFEETSHIDELKRIRYEYFSSTNQERSELQSQFDRLQKKMVLANVDVFRNSASKLYDTLSRWEPFEHNGNSWFDPDWMFGVEKFDIIIANPPYLGEKGHKELFREVKEDGLRQFYLGKMDLFYFFFHNALNLCKDDGIVAFITTNYYPTATGAKKLRKDFYERAEIKELINFNELRIFESALGQHNMITILQHSSQAGGATEIAMCSLKGTASPGMLSQILSRKAENVTYSTSNRSQLFDGEEYYIRFPSDNKKIGGIDAILDKMAKQGKVLGTICNVNQGIVSGADKFSNRHAQKYPDIDATKGEGIFVYDTAKNDYENIEPWYKNSDIGRYITNLDNKFYVLYLNPQAKPSLTELDRLEKFKPILSKRREVENGRIPWWSLQWGRSESIFDGPKIVAPQRSLRNTFGYNEIPWYASADVYFITPRTDDVDLKYLVGLLNSKLYYVWLYNRGKRKGETLELYQVPISEIPVKIAAHNQQQLITDVIDQILKAKSKDQKADTRNLESQIDQIIYQLYDLSPKEIETIEDYRKP